MEKVAECSFSFLQIGLCSVDFSVNLLDNSTTVLINGFDALRSVNHFTCTVKSDQSTGVYRLADSATFSKTVTLKNTSNQVMGELSLNESLFYDFVVS